MNEYINEFSYKGVTYYFNEPQLPEKTPENKIKIVAICSECGKEQLIPLRLFKDCINKRGKFLCATCKSANPLIFRTTDFPEEFHIEVLGPTYKNDPTRLRNNTKLKIECQECHQIREIWGLTLFNTYADLGTFICNSCKGKHTNYKFFGMANRPRTEEAKQKARETSIRKYGVDHYSKTDEYINRTKATNLERYGVENAIQSEEIKQKVRETNLKRYGVEYYIQSEEGKEKTKQTLLEKYGAEYTFQAESVKEKTKQTNIEKYGVDNYAKTEEFREKSKQTCLEKYGVENYAQTEEFLERTRVANLEKYGVENFMQSEEFREKSKQTCLEKYGTTSYTQTEEFLEKTKKTSLEKYGVDNYAKTEECQEKMKQTCLERYGVSSYSQTEEFKEKTKKTCLEKYGVEYYQQTEEFQKISIKKYKYKGINFDSSWELAFFIYYEDNNMPIIRLPQSIEYFLNGKSHHYFPDFLVDDQLIEIKSSAMLNPDYSLKPHIKQLNRCKTEEKKQYLYDLCAAKTQCMRENNVQILSDKEIKPYLKYIRDTYGKDYLKQFKQEDDQNTPEETDILDEEIEDIDELD